MEQNIKIKRNSKIIISLLSIVIIFMAISLLAAILALDTSNILMFIGGLAFPIIIIYWMKKKTSAGYHTARTWLTVFFMILLINGTDIPEGIDIYALVTYLIIVAIFSISALMVNSICKSFKANNESTIDKLQTQLASPVNTKRWWIIGLIFLGLLIVPGIIGAIVSYFNGTLTF